VLNSLVGQAMGSGNPTMAGIWLQQSMMWLTVTMLPCLTGLWYVEPILLKLGFPADVSQVAGVYAKWNVVWPIPNGLYQCCRFYFQAQGMARPAMYNNLIFLGVNALLNWIFVFGGPTSWNGLGFIGAAISLSISRTMQGVCYYLYMFVYKQHHLATWPTTTGSSNSSSSSFLAHHTKERTLEFLKQTIPNIGTLLFQSCASQATTVLVGRLGELSIAASSAISTVMIPWSGTLSATSCVVSSVRVGFHLGRGDPKAAQTAAYMVLGFVTIVTAGLAIVFVPLQQDILTISTSDGNVLNLAATLVAAMLVGTYLNLVVSIVTSGVFSGMGRPIIATILSFGLELPMSIGGVAIYILVMHGNLLGVYWWQAISGGIEVVIVMAILLRSNWQACADEAQARQEARITSINGNSHGGEEEEEDPEAAVGLLTETETTNVSDDANGTRTGYDENE
jgi:multidrug resistance protein, MATE family